MAIYLHFAPAVALAVAIGPRRIGWRLALAGACCAVLPDADLLMNSLHIDRHGGTYGHRGFTHAIGFALLVGALGALIAGRGSPRSGWLTAAYLALCTVSHPLLDGLIHSGICNAWLWPLDGARHCLPWRPIPMQGVPLFGPQRLAQELLWIGVPLLVLANGGMLLRLGWPLVAHHGARAGMRSHRLDPRDALDAPSPRDNARAERRRRAVAVRALVAGWQARHPRGR